MTAFLVMTCQGGAVLDVDFLLPGPGLALRVLHRDARPVKPVAKGAHHRLFLGGLKEVVVLVIGADRRQLAVAARMRLFKAFAEQVELQLRRHHRGHAAVFEPPKLALQDRARAHRNVLVPVVVHDVAQHQRRAFLPRDAAQRRQVGLHHVVAVALRPGRRLVARHRLHLHVDSKQVVARMGLVHARLQEMPRVEPLAHQPALHVDLRHDHGVDLARFDGGGQFIERQKSRHCAIVLLSATASIAPKGSQFHLAINISGGAGGKAPRVGRIARSRDPKPSVRCSGTAAPPCPYRRCTA